MVLEHRFVGSQIETHRVNRNKQNTEVEVLAGLMRVRKGYWTLGVRL